MKTRILVTLAVLALAEFVANALPVYAGANVNVGIPVGVDLLILRLGWSDHGGRSG